MVDARAQPDVALLQEISRDEPVAMEIENVATAPSRPGRLQRRGDPVKHRPETSRAAAR